MVNDTLKGVLLTKDYSGLAYKIRQAFQQRNVKLEVCSDFSYFFLNIDVFKFDFVFADSTTMEINSDLISVFTNHTSRFFIPLVTILNDDYRVEYCAHQDCFFMGNQYFLDNVDNILHTMKNRAYANKKVSTVSDDVILKYLKEWGISQKLAGFLYLKDAVNYLIKGHGKVALSKEIYPLLALKYDSSPCTIEKSIRYAISSSKKKEEVVCGNKEFINMIMSEVMSENKA